MSLFERNVDLGEPLKLSSWRKIAIGSWSSPGDPSVYGIMELNADAALKHIKKLNIENNSKVTLTHFIGKALGHTFAHHPQLNCILRFGRLYPRKNINIFFQVANDAQGNDLSGVIIRDIDKKSIIEITKEMQSGVSKVRNSGDPTFKQTKKTMSFVPGFLSKYVLNLTGFIMYVLNIWSPLFGAPQDAFGSLMITNIGSLGLGLAFAPLISYSRVPLLIAVGAVTEKPIVKDGKIEIAPMIQLGVTVDHRIIDGMRASLMAKTLQHFFAEPERCI